MDKNSKQEAENKKDETKNIPDFDEGKQCPVCIEVYTWSGARKRVVCPYCKYAACRECVETTLVDPEARKDPECFACHKTWTRDFIHDTFTKTFHSRDLKRHREQVLFDRERSLLPATQTILEALEQRSKESKALAEEENRLREEAKRIKERQREVRTQRFILSHTDVSNINMDTAKHNTFIRPCPAAGCRGYLSTRWKCPICEIWVCKECHVIKGAENDAEHRCKEEDVKSAALIMQETKPCPKCGTRIFKNGGCPQMWCTNCHTGFIWSSGKITNGPIHNPHYFEWLTQSGRDGREDINHDNGCGRINIHRLRRRGGDACIHIDWGKIVRFINEVTDALTRYPTENANTYLPLRLSFLKGEIDEDSFKRSLQMKEKRLNKLREEQEILQTFTTVAREELVRASEPDKKLKPREILNVYDRIVDLRTYVNSQLVKLSSQYNNVFKAINSTDWYWTDTNILQGKKIKEKPKKNKREVDSEIEPE